MADVERVGLVGEPSNALVGYLADQPQTLSHRSRCDRVGRPAQRENPVDGHCARAGAARTPRARLGDDRDIVIHLGDDRASHLGHCREEVREAACAQSPAKPRVLTIASTGKDPATGMLVTSSIASRARSCCSYHHCNRRGMKAVGRSALCRHQREPRANPAHPGAAAIGAHACRARRHQRRRNQFANVTKMRSGCRGRWRS